MSVPKRKTWQRDAVRVCLTDAQGFVSAQHIYAVLREQGSTIGLATVYRNLAQLTEIGEADSLQSPSGENLYRTCSTGKHHHHLICRTCGTTREIHAPVVEDWASNVGTDYGFSEVEHTINLFGLCQSCAA